MTTTPWNLDDYIRTREDLYRFLREAVKIVRSPNKLTDKDFKWLYIACSDFIRISNQNGWAEKEEK